jgi:hypothetical protein
MEDCECNDLQVSIHEGHSSTTHGIVFHFDEYPGAMGNSATGSVSSIIRPSDLSPSPPPLSVSARCHGSDGAYF